MAFKVFPSKLEERTLELFAKLPREIDAKDIAEATGLTANWISLFVNNKIKHPSAGRVEALYNYLSDKPLEV